MADEEFVPRSVVEQEIASAIDDLDLDNYSTIYEFQRALCELILSSEYRREEQDGG